MEKLSNVNTPYNVGSVLRRLFSTLEVVQYIRGKTSVLWGDNFSTVEVPQYSGGYLQYCGGIPSVLWGYLQYCGGCSVQWRVTSVQWGIASILWRVFSTLGDNISTVGDNISTVGDNISTVGDNISTVEGIQYNGGRILISACLVINNDEKISTFFVLRYENFIRKFFENSSRFHAF